MYELFDHTADLGLRVEAPDLAGLFVEAGRGFCAMLVDNPEAVRPTRVERLHVAGRVEEPDYLLFDWLNELLHRFEADGMLFAAFELEFDETGLAATAHGEPADAERHQLAHEVKAITYHGLRVAQTPSGWTAEVIVDI